MDDYRLLKVEEVARLTSLSRSKVYELVAREQLPSITIGRSRRVPAAALHRWLLAQINEPSSETGRPLCHEFQQRSAE